MKITKSRVLGLALNIMQECDCCAYCWNTDLNKRFHPELSGKLGIDDDMTELVHQLDSGIPTPEPPEKCQFYVNEGHDILLGAKTEFFH